MSAAAVGAMLIFGVLPMMIFIFICGKFSERAKWNKLIEDGIIPRPRKLKQPDPFTWFD